jgi:hypothetical protein
VIPRSCRKKARHRNNEDTIDHQATAVINKIMKAKQEISEESSEKKKT